MSKPLAKHGVSGVKYVERTGDNAYGTDIEKFLYTETISLTTIFSQQDVYADNRLLLRIPNDQGFDGQLGSTAPDRDFEIAAGMKLKLDDGTVATVKQKILKRMALYYEVLIEDEDGTKVMKVWLLNVTFAKPAETNATDTASITLNSVVYPLTVYGERVMADDTGEKEYRDENGLGRTALHIVSMPDDANYETFEESVPIPIKAMAT